MLCVFEVTVATGYDADALLSEEVLRETGAQVMTPEEARAVGFSRARPEAGGHEQRLIAVAPRDVQFVQRRLEANDAVLSFRLHEVEA
jgi:hypothetical protein